MLSENARVTIASTISSRPRGEQSRRKSRRKSRADLRHARLHHLDDLLLLLLRERAELRRGELGGEARLELGEVEDLLGGEELEQLLVLRELLERLRAGSEGAFLWALRAPHSEEEVHGRGRGSQRAAQGGMDDGHA